MYLLHPSSLRISIHNLIVDVFQSPFLLYPSFFSLFFFFFSSPRLSQKWVLTLSSSHMSMSPELDSWEKSHYLSLTIWDIELQFQKAREAYEEWLEAKNRRRRARLTCLWTRRNNDTLAKSLQLGRRVQELMEKGIGAFGHRFDKGDCTSSPLQKNN